jgi:hypothetical protein
MTFPALRNRSAFLVLSIFVSCACTVAQDVRVETQQSFSQRNQDTLGLRPPPAGVTDPELGDISLVSRQPRPKMFTFSTSQSINFTSNAFLVPNNEQSAFFWNGRFDASYVPYATRVFTPRITFEQNLFRYDHFSKLDFDSQSLQLDVKYDLNRNDTWFVTGSYALARLYSQHPSIGEFYKFGLLSGSITHLLQLRQAPVYLGITGGTYWRHGEPSSSDRVALYLNGVAIYDVRENVRLTGFVRPELQFYTNDPVKSSRTDFNLTAGATLGWTPVQYLTVAATASYIGNFSNLGARRYDVAMPSLIVAALFAF